MIPCDTRLPPRQAWEDPHQLSATALHRAHHRHDDDDDGGGRDLRAHRPTDTLQTTKQMPTATNEPLFRLQIAK